MKTFIIILFVFLGAGECLCGRSVKQADYAAASNYLRLVQWNYQSTGTLPASWSAIEAQHSEIPRLGNFSIKSKYGFLPSGIHINYQGVEYRVLVMALDGESEGRIIEDERDEPGRLMVLYSDPDVFRVARIREDLLEALFQNSGRDLAAFTGNQGSWSNSEEIKSALEEYESSDRKRPKGGAGDLSPDIRSKRENRTPITDEILLGSKSQRILVFIGLALALAFLVAAIFRSRKKKCSK